MRIITPVIYAGLLAASIYAALAQNSPIQLASTTTSDSTLSDDSLASVAVTAPDGKPTELAYAAPDEGTPAAAKKAAVRVGKRELCRQKVAAKHLKRRDARDQLQLCVAQARVECLQQAIEQKVRGISQRKLFVKACVAS